MYRISVKREGLISHKLHELQEGDLLEVQTPAGAFTIDATQRRPAVLLAAGIGITPILSMLRHLVHEGVRTGHQRPTWIFQSARSKAERVFDEEIGRLVKEARGRVRRIRVLSSPEGSEIGNDYDVIGWTDLNLLRANLPLDDYDFYLCGPASFMQSLYDGLRSISVSNDRIHAEAFGPSGLKRTDSQTNESSLKLAPSTVSVPVIFSKSAKEAQWNPGEGSILEIAEGQGLSPAYGCRNGSCGTCKVKVLEGQIAYTHAPTAEVGPGEALICCAVPANSDSLDAVTRLVVLL
jgi:ferredoxin-NADP reductase